MNFMVGECGNFLCIFEIQAGKTGWRIFEYTLEQKFAFLNKLRDLGVRNIEMESTCFAAMLCRGSIRGRFV